MPKYRLNRWLSRDHFNFDCHSWIGIRRKLKLKKYILDYILEHDIEEIEAFWFLSTKYLIDHSMIIASLKDDLRETIDLPYRLEMEIFNRELFGRICLDCTKDELMMAKFQMPDEFFSDGVTEI